MSPPSDTWHPLGQPLNCQVLDIASGLGKKLYLVGGYLRDVLSNRYSADCPPDDFDYAVKDGGAIKLARQVADAVSGHFVLLDESCDTARVVLDSGIKLDFAGCVGDSIEADLGRRDFTVNALAWSPDNPDHIIDLFNGADDLQKRIIRAISAQNFTDDPLRLLRAFRFAGKLEAEIEPATKEMIKAQAPKLKDMAVERINHELFLIFAGGNTSRLLPDMGDSGILEIIFPELSATREVTPNAFHHLDLWQHSLELVTQAESKLSSLPERAVEDCSGNLAGDISLLAATKIACLLHDIGKPGTWVITPEGRHTFYGHDALGAEMTEVIAERLRWSKVVSRFIVKLVRWHLRPGALFHQGLPTQRAINRFYRQIDADVPPLVLLALADLSSTCGEGLEVERRQALEKNLIELLDEYYVFKDSQQSLVRLLDGKRIMELLNIKPGPVLGEILEAVEEAQSLKEISTVADAERFVVEFYRLKHPH